MTVLTHQEPTAPSGTLIQRFYAGQNILVTGGTGFLGKLLLEKLLRSCPDLSAIYVLVRAKKGQDAQTRIEKLFDDPIFEEMKKQVPKYRHKVTAVTGDCSLPNLGMTLIDRQMLLREISVVFNVAATVKFDEKIKEAAAININGTKEMMDLCRQMCNLKVVMHVSTAYSNCNRRDTIQERFYEPPIVGDNLLKLTQSLDDKTLDGLTSSLLGDFPNTYTFTKCVAEQIVKQYGHNLPCGVFRPAIVISTYREPVTGWIDNVYGPTGALVGGGAGFIRTLNVDVDNTAELVPADLVVNALLVSAWDVANTKNEDSEPPIYNYTATWNRALTWGEYIDLAFKHGKQAPSLKSVWCYSMTPTKSFLFYYLLTIFLHIIPALIFDTALALSRRETQLLKLYRKVHKFSKVTSYFGMNKWNFVNNNTTSLWRRLGPEDQEIFFFSMQDFDWDDFMRRCVNGLRTYIFKDDPKTIPAAKKRMRRMVILHKIIKYSLVGLSFWALYKMCFWVAALGAKSSISSLHENIVIR